MSYARDLQNESPERDIEATREALGETVDALVRKADVKAQLSAKADQVKQRPAPVAGAAGALATGALLVWLVRRRRSR